MNKKKSKKKYIIISTIILLGIMIFFTAKSVKEDRKLNFFENNKRFC